LDQQFELFEATAQPIERLHAATAPLRTRYPQ
jgi:hypothetical protein